MTIKEKLIQQDKLRPVASGFGVGRFWQYREADNIYTTVPNEAKAIERAVKIWKV